MVTIPLEPSPGSEPHRARHIAESFGVDAERYDRTRPNYPDALIERIVDAAPGRDVLDVGSGTGIVARQFQATGARLLGVEPDARMAEFARRTGVESEVATFEDWEPAGRAFDAVIAGQSWHWVDPVAGAAKAARVLRPVGVLAVFWNVSVPEPALAEAFGEVQGRVLPELPKPPASGDGYAPMVAKAVEGIARAGAFGAPEEWRFEREQRYTRDQWLDLLPTQGLHTRLPKPALDELLSGVGAAIDAAGGAFTMRHTTVAAVAARDGE